MGYLKEGYMADITVFDENKIKDTATYEDPVSIPKGIEYVMINGSLTYFQGEIAKKRNGHVVLKT